MVKPYPLHWPVNYPKSGGRKVAQFKATLFSAKEKVKAELKRLGGTQLIISSNVPVRGDGEPYADYLRRDITDFGVAVYFQYNARTVVMCCDKWNKVEHNLHALALSIEAMRGLDRWGVSSILDRAFSGFEALPPAPNWWEVLQVMQTAPYNTVKGAYRMKVIVTHPDRNNGERIEYERVQRAWEDYLRTQKA